MKKRLVSFLLLLCMAAPLCGCTVRNGSATTAATSAPATDEQTTAPTVMYTEQMLNVLSNAPRSSEYLNDPACTAAYLAFAYDFFSAAAAADAAGNVCLSPFSAYMAFSLCFAGSDGVTADEFRDVFGLTKEQAADFCCSLYAGFLQRNYGDEHTKLGLANSVWIDEEHAAFVKEDYLAIATDSFNAPVFCCDFSDPRTVDAVNAWCRDNTDGLIEEIIREFNADEFMALINALLVEAAWADPYEDHDVVHDMFTNRGGAVTEATYLQRTIGSCYVTQDARAFRIPLCDGFSFVGILPDEDVSADDYCASLTAGKISALLGAEKSGVRVRTRIPTFDFSYDVDLIDLLTGMGLTAAFDPCLADFSPMAEIPGANVYIGRALQKTRFQLDEAGVKAAAVTYIGMYKETAVFDPDPVIDLFLDRPFVYLLIDDATGLPLFVGTVKTLP